MDYRSRLYEHYIDTHFGSIRSITLEALEESRVFYRAYFGRSLPTNPEAKILDVGCGYGAFLYFLEKEGYRNMQGVDISAEQVDAATNLGIANVYCEDLLRFVQKYSNEFNCITALDVIEHFPKAEILKVLDAVHGALVPGGTFILQTPNGQSLFPGAIRYADFTHEIMFTKEGISQVLRAARFTNITVHPAGPVAHGFLSAGRWLLWQMIRLLLQVYQAVETGAFRGHIFTRNLIAVSVKPDGEKAVG